MKEKIIIILAIILVAIGITTLYVKSGSTSSEVTKTVTKTDSQTKTPAVTPRTVVSGSTVNAKLGTDGKEYLVDSKGMTLYTFADDKNMKSSCGSDCINKWPAFMFDNTNIASSTDSLVKRLNLVRREDGKYQYAYGIQPLYYYAGDKNPGDMNGINKDVSGSKWNIVIVR